MWDELGSCWDSSQAVIGQNWVCPVGFGRSVFGQPVVGLEAGGSRSNNRWVA